MRAQTRDPVELTWHAPPGCPGAEDVQARIRKLLGAARVTGKRLRAEATINRSADERLQLTLIVRAGDLVGQRRLEGDACEDLAGAAAVNLVLLLHSASPPSAAVLEPRTRAKGRSSDARTRAAEPSTKASPQALPATAQRDDGQHAPAAPAQRDDGQHAPAAPAPARAAAEHDQQAAEQHAHSPALASREPPPAERSWRGLLQLPLLASAFGPMPRPSLGLGLAAGFALERWRVLAAAHVWLPQDLSAITPAGVGAHLDLVDAGLAVCRSFTLGRLELAPCVNVSIEQLWARGTGVHVAARTAQSTWIVAGVGGQLRFALTGWLGLLAGVDAQVGTARPRLSIDGLGRIGQLQATAVRITMGSEWIL